MKASMLLLLVIVTLLFSVTTTHAVLLSIDADSGTPGAIPGGAANELLKPIYGTQIRDGYYGSTVSLTQSASLVFTFLGFEAGYDNDFNLLGFGELFRTEDFTPSNMVSGISIRKGPFHFPGGVIPFSFDINNDAGTVANGSNPDDVIVWPISTSL